MSGKLMLIYKIKCPRKLVRTDKVSPSDILYCHLLPWFLIRYVIFAVCRPLIKGFTIMSAEDREDNLFSIKLEPDYEELTSGLYDHNNKVVPFKQECEWNITAPMGKVVSVYISKSSQTMTMTKTYRWLLNIGVSLRKIYTLVVRDGLNKNDAVLYVDKDKDTFIDDQWYTSSTRYVQVSFSFRVATQFFKLVYFALFGANGLSMSVANKNISKGNMVYTEAAESRGGVGRGLFGGSSLHTLLAT